MTQLEVFDAMMLHQEVAYEGTRWMVHSTSDDDTAELENSNTWIPDVPFTRIEKVEKGF